MRRAAEYSDGMYSMAWAVNVAWSAIRRCPAPPLPTPWDPGWGTAGAGLPGPDGPPEGHRRGQHRGQHHEAHDQDVHLPHLESQHHLVPIRHGHRFLPPP